MSLGELCTRLVVVAEPGTTVSEAARLMREHHVGDIVVVQAADGTNLPVGIVTDRDIVIGVLTSQLDPDTVLLGEIMTAPIATVRESDDVFETLRLMRERGIRRVPVVDDKGVLAGIIALDDFLELLAEQMSELAKVLRSEQAYEARMRK